MTGITEYNVPGGSINRRIALLCDLHDRKGDDVIAALKQQKPDIIAIAGDLVDGNRVDYSGYTLMKTVATDFLAKCSEIAPTYYSMGNHEWFLRRNEFDKIEKTGVKVLDNGYERIDDVPSLIDSNKIIDSNDISIFDFETGKKKVLEELRKL